MKHFKAYVIGLPLLAITIVLSMTYVIQDTVCSELQDILQFPSHYNVFTGCVLQIERPRTEIEGIKNGGTEED